MALNKEIFSQQDENFTRWATDCQRESFGLLPRYGRSTGFFIGHCKVSPIEASKLKIEIAVQNYGRKLRAEITGRDCRTRFEILRQM